MPHHYHCLHDHNNECRILCSAYLADPLLLLQSYFRSIHKKEILVITLPVQLTKWCNHKLSITGTVDIHCSQQWHHSYSPGNLTVSPSAAIPGIDDLTALVIMKGWLHPCQSDGHCIFFKTSYTTCIISQINITTNKTCSNCDVYYLLYLFLYTKQNWFKVKQPQAVSSGHYNGSNHCWAVSTHLDGYSNSWQQILSYCGVEIHWKTEQCVGVT